MIRILALDRDCKYASLCTYGNWFKSKIVCFYVFRVMQIKCFVNVLCERYKLKGDMWVRRIYVWALVCGGMGCNTAVWGYVVGFFDLAKAHLMVKQEEAFQYAMSIRN